jgi:dynein heavy chain 1
MPKLIAEDIPLFVSLLTAVFPNYSVPVMEDNRLIEIIKSICEELHYEMNDHWIEKILQLKQIQDIRHGIMLVGPTSTGKTTTWKVLLRALNKLDAMNSGTERTTGTSGSTREGDYYIIDAKSIRKDKLFGSLDPNTLEWTDGIFTKILRRLIDQNNNNNNNNNTTVTGGGKRTWIVFDGDVDPEWAENLNSVLDDNKILTLPSGDRLQIPSNVRILMEVDNLKFATLATVSRCGMIWFANNIINYEMIFRRYLSLLGNEHWLSEKMSGMSMISFTEIQGNTQRKFIETITPLFLNHPSIVEIALDFSFQQSHIMEMNVVACIDTLFAMLIRGITLLFEQNDQTPDFPLSDKSHIESFTNRWLLFSLNWAFGSSLSLEKRTELSKLLQEHSTVMSTSSISGGGGGKNKGGSLASHSLLDLMPNIQDGEWIEWSSLLPRTGIDIESHKISSSDVVISTVDTLRHTEVLRAWLQSRRPIILCGPPGSGKTMTLTSLLESLSNEFILVSLNFSSGTTPELILKTFLQYCEIVDSPDGLVLQPSKASYNENQWLVIFCDEINLPAPDSYGTQRVIMFLRQLAEQNGYWSSTSDNKWIKLKRIQFVGACNPPSDAGRTELSSRFLRQSSILFVDYPSEESLKQIYRCFNTALLKMYPNLKGFIDSLNDSMIEVYLKNKSKFTADLAPQYIYSPRELSRWVRAMYEAMESSIDNGMTGEELVRLWAHEGYRLFHDRLINEFDRSWCIEIIDKVANRHFPGIDCHEALKKPILFSSWIKKSYISTDREELRLFVAARLKVFYEEELDVPLCIFDEVLDHVLRIDNVLRHPIGHLLLVGEAGTGKTVLTRFVAWMNGLTVFQIKTNNRYTIDSFDDDLRSLFRRVGVEGEKICFIFDESNVLSSAFLERMNALLASGEIPGLFEGEEKTQLMNACREAFSQRGELMEGKSSVGSSSSSSNSSSGNRGGDGGGIISLDNNDELYRRFTRLIQRNLHVVFTMNPSSTDFNNRCTTSPALFNRCVVDWFGTWGQQALTQVASDFTFSRIDTGYVENTYSIPKKPPSSLLLTKELLKQEQIMVSTALVSSIVSFHNVTKEMVSTVYGRSSLTRQHYLSSRDYLDFINKFLKLEEEKRSELEDQQTHIRTGLQKLLQTSEQVSEMNEALTTKAEILKIKDIEANSKLSQMVEKQNEAEQRKQVAEQLSIELISQNKEISIRKETVEKELSEAEPALISAKNSVSNIRKSQLDEIRNLPKPPNAVKLTLEMVSIMIGENSLDWNDIRKVIRREDFIATVVNFDPLSLTTKQMKTISENYLSNTELDYASVDRASKACGPLFQWAGSQIKYATILKKIKPLRDEMNTLLETLSVLEIKQSAAKNDVNELETAIKTYKIEYANAIREAEIIRNEMEIVSKRVNRANALLSSLQEEKVRWESTSLSFDQQMSTLIGDCLIASAFLTYLGIFDYRNRSKLINEWSEVLESYHLPYRSELDMINYLSKPTEQLSWLESNLPNDTLAIQNAIIFQRFHRFPLIIDPAGQAYSFILSKFSSSKITQTSFLDNSFMKTLASSIRFGTPLLVNDVENMDPTLNPVLNREVQRTGGRTVIRIGNEDIDFSPKFVVILFTRNPYARFSPDLCSRVTIINFTITSSSLENQILSEILKSERPDINQKRNDILRLQSQQNIKLRELQDLLLDRISAVQGAILDDDSVIHTLEGIKKEAETLHYEVSQTSNILEEVKMISNSYLSLSIIISSSYFTLETMNEISFLYQYSLNFFFILVKAVLNHPSVITGSAAAVGDGNTTSEKKEDSSSSNSNTKSGKANAASILQARTKLLKSVFLQELTRRVLPGLRYEDKVIFLVRISYILSQNQEKYQHSVINNDIYDVEMDYLTKGSSSFSPTASSSATSSTSTGSSATEISSTLMNKFQSLFTGENEKKISSHQIKQLILLSLLPSFSGLFSSLQQNTADWITFLDDNFPEKCVPVKFLTETSGSSSAATSSLSPSSSRAPKPLAEERIAFLKLLIMRALRPERLLYSLEDYLSTVFSPFSFSWRDYLSSELKTLITKDITSATPVILCSELGQDPSSTVEVLSSQLNGGTNKRLYQVAMGSSEGIVEADRLIATASKNGDWILLRNVHLCIDWLIALEKKISNDAGLSNNNNSGSRGPGNSGNGNHENYRLFLTCEMNNSSLPIALLRKSEVLLYESSSGLKATLLKFFSSIPSFRIEKPPMERCRLYCLLVWFNAILHERLRYLPLGWTKKYEFNEADIAVSLDVIDQWIDEVCGHSSSTNRSNINPKDLPWIALQTLMAQSLYGGRIDHPFDQVGSFSSSFRFPFLAIFSS